MDQYNVPWKGLIKLIDIGPLFNLLPGQIDLGWNIKDSLIPDAKFTLDSDGDDKQGRTLP